MSTKKRNGMDQKMTTKQRKRINEFRLATWNVLSLNRVGNLTNLKLELNKYKIMIAALQEIRWKESCITDSGDYTMFCSSNNTANLGTGFLVHKNIKLK